MITRWYISPVVMVDGARVPAVQAELMKDGKAGEGCANYCAPLKNWFISKVCTDRHGDLTALPNVFAFEGDKLDAKVQTVSTLTRSFLAAKGIVAEGSTVRDLIEAAIRYHEPTASVAGTWAG